MQHFLKKDFRHKFSFFNGLSPTPQPLNQPKFVKFDGSFLLRLPNFGTFVVLYLGYGCMTFNFMTQMILCHVLPMPMNEDIFYNVARDL